MSGEFSRRKVGADTEEKIAMMKKVSEEVSANDEKSSEDSLDEDSAPDTIKLVKLEVD